MSVADAAALQFRIHLEYGHYEHYLYWGFDLLHTPTGALLLRVQRDDGTRLDVPLGAVRTLFFFFLFFCLCLSGRRGSAVGSR
jgi:hypothetical protein